ncbi:MAG: hypothetical protein JNL50_14865 [Phycisphaerae bacterium]|nr:hypothetical protein [Phycisphaerae bacterium]
MLRSHARNATALVSLIISVAALAAAHPFPDPPVPDPCDGFSDANGNFGYPACDRDNVSRFYNPITDTPSFDSVCWHGVTTTAGGNPSVVYPAFSGFNNLNANLFWGPQPGDYPPRKLDLAAGSSPLISSDAPSRRGPWPTLERPTIADTVDLITGQPLLQEIDFELPFGSALFRHTRTYAGISPHSRHDWDATSALWENHAPEPDSTEAMWDWNGHAWMMGEAPLFLMDARYWG